VFVALPIIPTERSLFYLFHSFYVP
jgi:hypothetical protein